MIRGKRKSSPAGWRGVLSDVLCDEDPESSGSDRKSNGVCYVTRFECCLADPTLSRLLLHDDPHAFFFVIILVSRKA